MTSKAYSNKSYVTMEQHVCIVCGHPFDTGSILLNRRLQKSFDRHTITGRGLCPKDKAKFDEGYIALVAVSNSDASDSRSTLSQENACRTGDVAHIRGSVWTKIFNTPLPVDEHGKMMPMAFCGDDVITLLQKITTTQD